MGFVNLEALKSAYNTEPMVGNVERLIDFDMFHCLRAGSPETARRLGEKYPCFPKEYLKWLEICDGGLLFDTSMMCTEEHDDELDLDFDTYDELNSEDALSDYDLPEGYVVFALLSFGAPVCFSVDKEDEKVYLWDPEEGEFTDIWDNFTYWLTEEIDSAVSMIADGDLDPLEVKLESGGDD